MTLKNIVAGDKGNPIGIRFLKENTLEALDISGYTEKQTIIFLKPGGEETPVDAEFKTDGKDGIIWYHPPDNFIVAGRWMIRGRVESETSILSTIKHTFTVQN